MSVIDEADGKQPSVVFNNHGPTKYTINQKINNAKTYDDTQTQTSIETTATFQGPLAGCLIYLAGLVTGAVLMRKFGHLLDSN